MPESSSGSAATTDRSERCTLDSVHILGIERYDSKAASPNSLTFDMGGSFNTMSIMVPPGISKDPFVPCPELCEGVLVFSWTPQAVIATSDNATTNGALTYHHGQWRFSARR